MPSCCFYRLLSHSNVPSYSLDDCWRWANTSLAVGVAWPCKRLCQCTRMRDGADVARILRSRSNFTRISKGFDAYEMDFPYLGRILQLSSLLRCVPQLAYLEFSSLAKEFNSCCWWVYKERSPSSLAMIPATRRVAALILPRRWAYISTVEHLPHDGLSISAWRLSPLRLFLNSFTRLPGYEWQRAASWLYQRGRCLVTRCSLLGPASHYWLSDRPNHWLEQDHTDMCYSSFGRY